MKHPVTHALIVMIGAAALALTGCAGKDGTSCTVAQTATGARITCDDGTHVDVNNGTDGSACTATDNGDGTKTISCDDGTTVTVADGTNGTSCTVTDANGTKTIKCADGTSVTVRDGASGEPGGNVEIASLHGEQFLKSEGEFALTNANPKFFVKPQITSATVVDGVVTVNFKVQTQADQAFKALTAVNVGIAKLVPQVTGEVTPHWVSYIYRTETVPTTGTYPNPAGTTRIQANRESSGTGASNGTLTNHGDGTYTYVMKTNLTTAKRGTDLVGYDGALTHRITLTMGGHSGPTGDVEYDFVPAGGAVTTTRNIVQTQVCQNCHGFEFHGHGGDRITADNCVTCHNPGNEDANGGESIDFSVMIHKIHAGGELQSIPGADGIVWDDPVTTTNEAADNGKYIIWGYGNSAITWWKVEFPAVIENCTTCHQGTAANVDNWKTKPNRAACGSCHDKIDFEAGTGHAQMTSDTGCAGCHPATGTINPPIYPISAVHDWVAHDPRKQEEYAVELSMTPPANGTHYVAGEKPVVTVVLKRDGVAIDHTLGAGAATGCVPSGDPLACPAGDDKLATSNLFVSGPRALRRPVLTYPARAAVFSATTGPWDLSAGGTLSFKADQGEDLVTFDSSGGDKVVPAAFTVTVASSAFATPAAATADELATALNANAGFKARAIAYVEGGKLGVRTRAKGKTIAIQLTGGTIADAIFGTDRSVKMPGTGGYTVSAVLTSTTDPMVTRATDKITYQLDDVADLAPGTYVVYAEIADAGRISETNYITPSIGKLTFQVGTATAEKLVADSCNSCHQSPGGKGFVLDYSRHNKKFGTDAVDGCGSCHDYQPASATGGAGWAGARAIAKRVHAVHNGSSLNYPLATVDYPNGDPVKGRNWDITYPMDVRNCESCHSAATSGTWKTKPSRLACLGCHDADAAKVHVRLNTFDPTPDHQWSGDEQESCAACHK